jgi:hypothetical protein
MANHALLMIGCNSNFPHNKQHIPTSAFLETVEIKFLTSLMRVIMPVCWPTQCVMSFPQRLPDGYRSAPPLHFLLFSFHIFAFFNLHSSYFGKLQTLKQPAGRLYKMLSSASRRKVSSFGRHLQSFFTPRPTLSHSFDKLQSLSFRSVAIVNPISSIKQLKSCVTQSSHSSRP